MVDKKITGHGTLLDPEATLTDTQRAMKHVQENPLLYAVGLIVVVLVAALGSIFTLTRTLAEREYITRYANAMESEDPSTRAAELEVIADLGDDWGVEAAYMMAEDAIRAGEPEKARETFEQIVSRAANTRYAPRAAEGLAYLAENSGDLDAALAGYQEVADRWQDSFEGRTQHMNIARVLEKQDKLEQAIEHLNQQIEVFPESQVATMANVELTRLKGTHPDLFPADEPEADVAADVVEVEESTEVAEEVTEDATEAVAETPTEVVEETAAVEESMPEAATEAAEATTEAVEEAATEVETATETAVEEVVETVTDTVDEAATAVEDASEAMAEEAAEVTEAIVDEAKEAGEAAADTVETAVDAVVEAADSAVETAEEAVEDATATPETAN